LKLKSFVIVGLSLLGIIYSCGNAKSKKNINTQTEISLYSVTISTTHTDSYCGGAKPTPEMEMEYRRKKVYPNIKIYVRKGEINDYATPPILILTTDEKGQVTTGLPIGKYTFVFENKADEKTFKSVEKSVQNSRDFDNLNTDCLDRFFKLPDGSIEINGNEDSYKVELNRHFNCSWNSIPCARFTGNLPPSAIMDRD
jgi:hypothetical protein